MNIKTIALISFVVVTAIAINHQNNKIKNLEKNLVIMAKLTSNAINAIAELKSGKI